MLSRLLSAGNDDQHMHRRLSTQHLIRPERTALKESYLNPMNISDQPSYAMDGKPYFLNYYFRSGHKPVLSAVHSPTALGCLWSWKYIDFYIRVPDWMRRNAGGDGTRPLTGHCHHRHYWARPAQVATPLPPPPSPLSLNNLRTKNMTPTISSSNPLNILSRPLDHSHIFYVSLVWMQ